MSLDKLSSEHSHERERTPEQTAEHTHEQLDTLRKKHERDQQEHETDHEAQEQSARHEALKQASSAQEQITDHEDQPAPEHRNGPITKKQLNREFTRTMSHIQTEMPAPQRAFSKVLHNPAVEKTSEFLGATVARPNAMLAGAMGGFILTLAFYVFAKTLGYPLSGFEPIGAFLIGWVVGLLYDYLHVMITGKR